MAADKKQLLIEHLLETSFLYSDTPQFPLASGKMSRYYIDCKTALSHARCRVLVGDLILERLYEARMEARIDAVGGLLLGAYPVAIAVSDAAARRGESIAAFAVRKESKGHGLKKYLEGDIEKGQRVLVVEDVVTTGQSTLQAVRRCREEGLEVVAIFALLDRQEEGGREKIQKIVSDFDCILTISDLLAAYQKKSFS